VTDIIEKYTATTNLDAQEAFRFIVANKKKISRPLLKEMILNYRTYFKRDQKDRIVKDYKEYIIDKTTDHNSDLAIGYNIVKFVKVKEEKDIIDYLYSRLADKIDPNLAKIDFLKRRVVMEYIEKNVLIKNEIPNSRSI
jgi:hypothetical protein